MSDLFHKEEIKGPETYSLKAINLHLKKVVDANFVAPIWITAEIAQVNIGRGNYFLDLVEKENEVIVAQAEAAIWRKNMEALRELHGEQIQHVLKIGSQIQFKAQLSYNERYGFKFVILDVDLRFTLGQMALKRQETLSYLKKNGLLHKNKQLSLPVFPQRIAILSSRHAAGLQDFLEQLVNNPYKYRFHFTIFNAAVQGDKMQKEMTEQLKLIEMQKDKFDCIAIMRGGGARLDLAGFDELELCEALANASLPVITGIGHEIDETIADLVAHTPLKTPTATADFLLTRGIKLESQLQQLAISLNRTVGAKLTQGKLDLQRITQKLTYTVKSKFQRISSDLDLMAKIIETKDPEKRLKEGYGLLLKEGKIILDPASLKKGDPIKIKLAGGSLEATIENWIPKTKNNN